MKTKTRNIVFRVVALYIALNVVGYPSITVAASSFYYSETNMKWSENDTSLRSDEKGKVYFFQYEDANNGSAMIKRYDFINNELKNTQSIKYADSGNFNFCVNKHDRNNTATVAGKYKKGKRPSIIFTTYNENGKKIRSFKDYFLKADSVIDNIGINSMRIKGKKLFYTYYKTGNNSGFYIRCINNKTGRLISNNRLNAKNNCYIFGNQIYSFKNKNIKGAKKVINVYNLSGKKISCYKLPDIENTSFDSFYVFNNYIYYTNGKDGIYKCNMKKNYKWLLFYDAKDDPYFSECRVHDICVADKDTFFVSYVEKINLDLCIPSKLVKYSND